MSNDKTYNGWSNYETWNVNLWMDNDGSDEYWRERAADLRDVSDLAREIKDQHEENMPELVGCYSDLLSAALHEVNWYEIAEHYIDDLEPEEEDDEDEADGDA